jgi:hypothetical protein
MPLFAIVQGGDQVVGVLVRVLAQEVQPNGVEGKGLHLLRVLEPLPAQQQTPGYGLLRRHTYPCTGTHATLEGRGGAQGKMYPQVIQDVYA